MKKVEVRTLINTEPENIIKAFTELEMLRDWWNVEKILIQKKEGGLYTLTWNVTENGIGYVSTGVIRSYDPKRELIISDFVYLNPERPFLGPMGLKIQVKPTDGASELYLCQDGYQEGEDWDWYYEAVKIAWPVVIETLKKYLERKTI